MTSALITGGTGFIGLNLAKNLLSKGYSVTLVDNLFRGKNDKDVQEVLRNKKAKFVKCDLTDAKRLSKLKKHDYVFHLAAINGTKYFYEIPDIVLRTNILTTLNMLEWYAKHKGKRLVFSSSSEAYAGTIKKFGGKVPTPEDIALSIDDVFNARWSYGGSKLAGELLVINYGRQRKFDFSIVRYHNIYGPRMGHEHVIPEFVKRIVKKENPFTVKGGKETRAFCFVSDAVEATRKVAIASKTADQIVNVGNSREEIGITELAKRLFRVAKVNPKFKILPAPKGSVSRRCPDTTKQRKLAGFVPKVSLNEGLKITFDWYREHYLGKKQ